MTRSYKDALVDMYEAIVAVDRFIGKMSYQRFAKDEKTLYAVIRALEIIGEASKKVPKQVQQRNAHIPWRQIAGMRDKLIHDYFGVDVKVVWITATVDVPSLKDAIRSMIDE